MSGKSSGSGRSDPRPIHLGIILVVNLTSGLITPAVGTSLFVACRIANISITELIRRCCRCSRSCSRC